MKKKAKTKKQCDWRQRLKIGNWWWDGKDQHMRGG